MPVILPDSEFCSMIVTCSRVKIHENCTLFYTPEKTIERKARQYGQFHILEELMSVFDFRVCYHVKAILYLCSYLVFQIF